MFSLSNGKSGGGLPAAFMPLATISSLLATVMLGPSVFPVIEPFVRDVLNQQYRFGTASWLALAAELLTYPFCFYMLRVSFLAALTAITAFTTKRLM